MAGGVGVRLTAQDPGSSTFSNVRTSASLSKWVRISIRTIGVIHSRSSSIACLTSPASTVGRYENRHHADVSAMNGAIAFQQLDGIHRRSLRLVVRQLLDVLKRIPIKPARAKDASSSALRGTARSPRRPRRLRRPRP